MGGKDFGAGLEIIFCPSQSDFGLHFPFARRIPIARPVVRHQHDQISAKSGRNRLTADGKIPRKRS